MKVDKSKWKQSTLGELFDLQMGKTPSRKDLSLWEGGNIPWVSISDMKDSRYISETKELLPSGTVAECRIPIIPIGTVIMSFKLTIGKTCIVSKPLTTNEAIMAFYPKKGIEVNSSFLAYALSALKWKGNRAVKGLTINKKTISEKDFSLPSLKQQESIASELDALQEVIDGYREQMADLDALAQSIFIDTFGHVSINDKEWPITLLGELGSFKNGLNFDKQERGTKIKVIGVGDFKALKRLDDFQSISLIELSNISDEYLLSDGDIIFVRSNGNKNLVGRCLEVFPGREAISYSGFCIRFRKESDINNSYLLGVLTDTEYKTAHILKSNGIGIQNINQKILTNLPIPVPPIELQQQFADQVEAIENQKELLRQQLADAEMLMAERMQYYFS